MHLVSFVIRIYHDARSPERQNFLLCVPNTLRSPSARLYSTVRAALHAILTCVQFADVQQANQTYQHNNMKEQLYKINAAATRYNETCRHKQLTTNNISIKTKGDHSQCLNTITAPTHYTLQTTHYTQHTTHYALRTTHYALLATRYTLHTTHYTQHTTHYTLHTTV